MKLWSDSFDNESPTPERLAFGKPSQERRLELSDNLNPHFAWSDLPEGTKSLALVCVDPDAPSKPDDVNQEGKTVPADLPRVDFYHWILVDVDPSMEALQEGAFSKGVTLGGKSGPDGPFGTRQGVNSYTQFLAGNSTMKGTYYGYDGPCPPWNDEIVHHYHFTLYALDVERCPVDGDDFDGQQVRDAIEGHVLDQATWTGTYTLNSDLFR